MTIGIVLFRNDLRLRDNPALVRACETCDAVVPVFVWAPLGMTALGAVAGVVPAVKAYATDVADNLTPVT